MLQLFFEAWFCDTLVLFEIYIPAFRGATLIYPTSVTLCSMKTEFVTARFDPAETGNMDRARERIGMNRSEFVRYVVRRYLDSFERREARKT